MGVSTNDYIVGGTDGVYMCRGAAIVGSCSDCIGFSVASPGL